MLLLQALFVCEGYTDDTLYGAGEEDEVLSRESGNQVFNFGWQWTVDSCKATGR